MVRIQTSFSAVVLQYSFYLLCKDENLNSIFSSSNSFSQEPRLSAKHMFGAKIQSEILDFANHFELLHFHFDQWLYKTVTGLHFISSTISNGYNNSQYR